MSNENGDANKVLEKIDDRVDSQVGYHFLRRSGAEFASDLREFAKKADNLSNDQLLNIISYGDDIRNKIEGVRFILSKRVK